MIRITRDISIEEESFELRFVRASGPGGQNVNKVATACQLRFDVQAADLPEPVRRRLAIRAGRRMTNDGILIIDARKYRTQKRNRDDAISRLVDLLKRAAVRPPVRRPTRPSAGSRRRRIEAKRRRSGVKQLRRRPVE